MSASNSPRLETVDERIAHWASLPYTCMDELDCCIEHENTSLAGSLIQMWESAESNDALNRTTESQEVVQSDTTPPKTTASEATPRKRTRSRQCTPSFVKTVYNGKIVYPGECLEEESPLSAVSNATTGDTADDVDYYGWFEQFLKNLKLSSSTVSSSSFQTSFEEGEFDLDEASCSCTDDYDAESCSEDEDEDDVADEDVMFTSDGEQENENEIEDQDFLSVSRQQVNNENPADVAVLTTLERPLAIDFSPLNEEDFDDEVFEIDLEELQDPKTPTSSSNFFLAGFGQEAEVPINAI